MGVAGREIVYGVGELTAQALDPSRSILLVQCEKYLGVAVGAKRVRQPCPQLTVVQNLPVEDEVSVPAQRLPWAAATLRHR